MGMRDEAQSASKNREAVKRNKKIHQAPPAGAIMFIKVSADLPADAATYMLERDSAAYRSLMAKMLELGSLEFVDLWQDPPSTFVRMVTKPKFGAWVPKAVQRQLAAGTVDFHDIIEYRPEYLAASPYKILIRTLSPFLGDRLDVRMTLSVERLGERWCRQSLEGHVNVQLLGVGRVVEGIVRDSLVSTYRRLPEVVRRWQVFRAEALAAGNGAALLLGRPAFGSDLGWVGQGVAAAMQAPLLPVPVVDATQAALERQLSEEVLRCESSSRYYDASEAFLDDLPQHCGDQLRAAVRLDRLQTARELGPKDVIWLPQTPAPDPSAPPAARAPGHRRSASAESSCSVDLASLGEGDLAPKMERLKASKGMWRRFNRQYREWDEVWDDLGIVKREGSNAAVVRLVHVADTMHRQGALQVATQGSPGPGRAGQSSPVPEGSSARGREPSSPESSPVVCQDAEDDRGGGALRRCLRRWCCLRRAVPSGRAAAAPRTRTGPTRGQAAAAGSA